MILANPTAWAMAQRGILLADRSILMFFAMNARPDEKETGLYVRTSLQEVHRRLGCTPKTASTSFERLKKLGLIEQFKDKRMKLIKLNVDRYIGSREQFNELLNKEEE